MDRGGLANRALILLEVKRLVIAAFFATVALRVRIAPLLLVALRAGDEHGSRPFKLRWLTESEGESCGLSLVLPLYLSSPPHRLLHFRVIAVNLRTNYLYRAPVRKEPCEELRDKILNVYKFNL